MLSLVGFRREVEAGEFAGEFEFFRVAGFGGFDFVVEAADVVAAAAVTDGGLPSVADAMDAEIEQEPVPPGTAESAGIARGALSPLRGSWRFR